MARTGNTVKQQRIDALIEALNAERKKHALTWRDLGILSGFTSSFLVYLSHKKYGLSLEGFLRLEKVVEFMKEEGEESLKFFSDNFTVTAAAKKRREYLTQLREKCYEQN